MIRSYTTEVSLFGLPIDDTSGGMGERVHLGGGGGGRYEGLGGLGTFPGVCWALRACLISPHGVLVNGIFLQFLALFGVVGIFVWYFFSSFLAFSINFYSHQPWSAAFFNLFTFQFHEFLKSSSSTLDFRTLYVRSSAVVCLLRFSASHRCFTMGSKFL